MDSAADRKNDSSICTNTLVGGWEREKIHRAAKGYDDDGHSKVIGLRLLLLAAVIMVAKALPPQTNVRQMTKRLYCRHGAKILAALRRLKPDGYGGPW